MDTDAPVRKATDRPYWHTVRLEHPVLGELAGELARRVYYLAEEIIGFDLLDAEGRTVRPGRDRRPVHAVRLSVLGRMDPAALDAKLMSVVDREIRDQLLPRHPVVWRSARELTRVRPVIDELVANGMAIRCGVGRVALSGTLLGLFDRLDALLRDIAVTDFAATEVRYPSTLPTAVLHRAGYLTALPQHVMFAARLHSDVDSYRGFLEAMTERASGPGVDLGPLILRHCTDVEHCLPPTICYHTFQQFTDRSLPADHTVVTARGKAFRYESRYHADLERLADFTIREVVFLGSRSFTRTCRDRFLARATDLMDELELSGHCEVANDPFFGNRDTGSRASAQRLLELKYELRLPVAEDRDVAVGSLNLHDQLFGEAFGIRTADGQAANSSCVGFGLERFAYAVVCQHGVDERRWPALLR